MPGFPVAAAIEGIFLTVGIILLVIFGIIFFGLITAMLVKTAKWDGKSPWTDHIDESTKKSVIAFGAMFMILFFPIMYSYNVGITKVGKAAAACRPFGGYGLGLVWKVVQIAWYKFSGQTDKLDNILEITETQLQGDAPVACNCIQKLSEAIIEEKGKDDTGTLSKITKGASQFCNLAPIQKQK